MVAALAGMFVHARLAKICRRKEHQLESIKESVMRLGRRSSHQEEAQIDLTSMLDIVFIMLIFFIVTSSFVRESGVEVNRPQASNVSSQKTRVYLWLSLHQTIFLLINAW